MSNQGAAMDKGYMFRFLKPSVGRVLLFLLFSLMAWLIFQMGMVNILGMAGFIFGLIFLFLFLPFLFIDFPGPREISYILTWIIIPVYWYLMACTIVVLDKRIRDRRFGRDKR